MKLSTLTFGTDTRAFNLGTFPGGVISLHRTNSSAILAGRAFLARVLDERVEAEILEAEILEEEMGRGRRVVCTFSFSLFFLTWRRREGRKRRWE